MLVVSRKVGERILIGEQITVTVVKVSGGGVRIGVEAPMELPILREELAAQILDTEEFIAGKPNLFSGGKPNLDDQSE